MGKGSNMPSRYGQAISELRTLGSLIDVLAERMDTTRGALYKTLHDARRKLRAHLGARGLGIDGEAA